MDIDSVENIVLSNILLRLFSIYKYNVNGNKIDLISNAFAN